MVLFTYLTLFFVLCIKLFFPYKKCLVKVKKSNIFYHVQYENASFDQNLFIHDERVRVSIATRFLDFPRNAQMSQQTG